MNRYTSWSVISLMAIVISGVIVVGVSQGQTTKTQRKIVIESVANELKFDLTEIRVASGEAVNLVFVNRASVQGMLHNVVILLDEKSIDRVGVAAISAADSEYIPEDDAVLFHTPLAAPGDTVEVTFTAPQPGTYYFACTYLGHYVLMRGVFIVS